MVDQLNRNNWHKKNAIATIVNKLTMQKSDINNF
jgi:hypothetical protein